MKFLISLLSFSILLASSCQNNKGSNKQTGKGEPVNSIPQNEFGGPDQSPMDMAYLPSNFPLLKMKGRDSVPVVARVIYSRPHKKGRKIFGTGTENLCRYGVPWRLGANEATEIEFFRPVVFNGQAVQPGRYVMYCIPQPDKWTIILNTNLYAWGLHINREYDVVKTDLPVRELSPSLEDFTMVFLPASGGAELLMAWDNVKVLLPIQYQP